MCLTGWTWSRQLLKRARVLCQLLLEQKLNSLNVTERGESKMSFVTFMSMASHQQIKSPDNKTKQKSGTNKLVTVLFYNLHTPAESRFIRSLLVKHRLAAGAASSTEVDVLFSGVALTNNILRVGGVSKTIANLHPRPQNATGKLARWKQHACKLRDAFHFQTDGYKEVI